MPVDLFSVQVLNGVLRELREPTTFFLRFFNAVQEATNDEIYFDIEPMKKNRIAPFVSPRIPGKLIGTAGFSTKSFRPAYVKPKTRFDSNAPLKRMLGEALGGSMTPMQRRNLQIRQAMTDHLEMLATREHVMAAEALRLGQVTVSGDDYPTVVVNFGRPANQTITLAGASRWGQAGIKPVSNLETWAGLAQTACGARTETIIMDPKAFAIFRDDAQVEKWLDQRRPNGEITISQMPYIPGQGEARATYQGRVGPFEIWTYQDSYYDDTNVQQQILPDYTVIGVDPVRLEGTRAYGLIHDEEQGFTATRYFIKSWVEKDPAVRYILSQSAPLVIPYRAAASWCATVN